MRLGVVTTSYPRGPEDPAGCFVAEQVAWLRAAGGDVDVIAAGDRGAERIDGRGLFYRGGAPEALEADPRALLRAALVSADYVRAVAARAHTWDAAIAHWLAPSALAVAVATRLPMVAIAHSGDVDLLCRTRLATPAAALLRARGAHLVFVSQALRDRFRDAVRTRVLRRWVDRARVSPMGIHVANSQPSSGDGPVVFLGRLVPIKGVDVLLDAAARLPSLRFAIAGDGPERPRLAARASRLHNTRVLGEIAPAARDRLLATARAVVVPSRPRPGGRTEGAPRVVLEAMAAGAPVIASATGGLAEIPPGAITCVRPGDPAALAAGIAALAGDPDRRRRQVDTGLRYARALDWSVVGPRLVEPLRIFHEVRN